MQPYESLLVAKKSWTIAIIITATPGQCRADTKYNLLHTTLNQMPNANYPLTEK